VIILNFSHPLTTEQISQIGELTGQEVERVVDVNSQIDVQRPLAEQVQAMVEACGLTSNELQTLPIILNLPALNYSAAVLLAELNGRMGYFPAVIRLRPVAGSTPPRFEVAEILNLAEVRAQARCAR